MSIYASPRICCSRSVTPMSARISDMMPTISDHNIGMHLNKTGEAGLGHAKNYFNSARVTWGPMPKTNNGLRAISNTMYSRYSHADWDGANKANFSLSERERGAAERLRADVFRTAKAAEARTRNRQSSNTKRLTERLYGILMTKTKRDEEINSMEIEIESICEHKRALERFYHDTRGPLSITEECLMQREKRQSIDQVHDDVEKSLSREVATIKKCQDKIKRLLEKAQIQQKMNRAALHACDRDAKDKHHAQNLDDRMQQLRNSSAGLGFYPGIENVDNTITIPYSWMKFTQENILRSQKEREISEKLRGEIDCALRACANELWSMFNTVNTAFQSRIQETTDAKNKLQAHLERTNGEIRDMERSIDFLKKAIHDKEAPMKVAQTRLNDRTGRINVELCNDPSMKGLQREVNEIRESVRILKDKLRAAENHLVRLLKTRQALQEDISVKENSLMIDSKSCMGMRKNMALDPKLGPIMNMPMSSF